MSCKWISTEYGEKLIIEKNTEISEILDAIMSEDFTGECLYLTSDVVLDFSEGEVE